MSTSLDVEAALTKLRSARFTLYVKGQQRNEVALRQARYQESIETLNQQIADARAEVKQATDELLLAMMDEEPAPAEG